MCLEDLRLGRGRYQGTSQIITGPPLATFPGNALRVGYLVSWIGWLTADAAGNPFLYDWYKFFTGANNQGTPWLWAADNGHVKFHGIETHGQLITSPLAIVVANASGLASLTMTEILTDVIAEPMGFH